MAQELHNAQAKASADAAHLASQREAAVQRCSSQAQQLEHIQQLLDLSWLRMERFVTCWALKLTARRALAAWKTFARCAAARRHASAAAVAIRLQQMQRHCLRAHWSSWQQSVAAQAACAQVKQHKIQQARRRCSRILHAWDEHVVRVHHCKALAEQRRQQHQRCLSRRALLGWHMLCRAGEKLQLQTLQTHSSERRCIGSCFTAWHHLLQHRHQRNQNAQYIRQRHQRALMRNCLRAWHGMVTMRQHSVRTVKALWRRHRLHRLQRAFLCWRCGAAAASQEAVRLRTCIGGKRVAQAAFKMWYSNLLEENVAYVRFQNLYFRTARAMILTFTCT